MTIRDIPFGRPWVTDEDRKAVLAVLDGPILTHGPAGRAFEEEFAHALGPDARCVSVSSCMAALHLSYLALGVGAGDEVVVPAQTHAATAHAVEWTGATPVFVDCDLQTGNVTAEAIAAAIGPRTRAIGLVHFVGIPCGMPAILALAARRGLPVVEDCALAVGARHDGRHVGLHGDAGCFSFYPVKHLTTAEGGMFVTRRSELAERVARLRAFGVERPAAGGVPGQYDVTALGLNYRMSELQAALGRSQLARLETALRRRSENFTALKAGLEVIGDVTVLDAADPAAASSHYCVSALFGGRLGARRDDIVRRLNAAGVGTSVYYPRPVPLMTYYRTKYGHRADRFPNAAALSERSVALPTGPHVTLDDVDHIVGAVSAAVSAVRG